MPPSGQLRGLTWRAQRCPRKAHHQRGMQLPRSAPPSYLWLFIVSAPPFPCYCSRTNTGKTNKICETTRDVKSYAGYVHLPAGSQYAAYEQNIFFWFFEARKDPKRAPLTVWLQGGPGMGSTAQVGILSRLSSLYHTLSRRRVTMDAKLVRDSGTFAKACNTGPRWKRTVPGAGRF